MSSSGALWFCVYRHVVLRGTFRGEPQAFFIMRETEASLQASKFKNNISPGTLEQVLLRAHLVGCLLEIQDVVLLLKGLCISLVVLNQKLFVCPKITILVIFFGITWQKVVVRPTLNASYFGFLPTAAL